MAKRAIKLKVSHRRGVASSCPASMGKKRAPKGLVPRRRGAR